jgi:23S rRNA-intervening sequence protein
MFRFERLVVWHKAIEFADHVYSATKGFPVDERFGLTSQLRRAAVSISSNIAAGSGRPSDKEFARFLEIAYGSVMEGRLANENCPPAVIPGREDQPQPGSPRRAIGSNAQRPPIETAGQCDESRLTLTEDAHLSGP